MTEQSEAPKVVNMLALRLYCDFVKARGDDPARLFGGLALTLDDVADRTRWIAAADFAVFEDNLAALYPDEPRIHFLAGRSLANTSIPIMGALVRSAISPAGWYALQPRAIKLFFRFASVRLERRGRRDLSLVYTFSRDYTPTHAWIETASGIVTAVPLMMGVSAPDLEVTATPGGGLTFHLTFTNQWFGPLDFLRQTWRRVRTTTAMRWRGVFGAQREVMETNRLLLDKVQALEVVEADLDRRIRQLSVVNALNQASLRELDLDALLTKSVAAIHEQLHVGVCVFLGDGVNEAFEIAAQVGVSAARIAKLEAAFEGWGGRLPEQPTIPGDGRVHWLDSRDARLGGLVVFAKHDDDLAAVIESLAIPFAAAIANASSYRTMVELRDSLEHRVQERTSALESARHALQETVEKLESADKATRDFFTNVSHEFRTPLTLILAPLEALLAEMGVGGTEAARQTIAGIQRNAHSLLRLINEILDFARMDSAQMPVHPESIELGGFLRELVGSLQEMAARAGVTLSVETPALGVPVKADPRLLRRACGNVLVNAIKYIRRGDSVRVTLALREADQRAIIEVADDGPGIPEARREQVFERFRRLEDGDGNAASGTGIGLAMVRAIMELHGGTVRLVGNVPCGARFISEMPVDQSMPRTSLSPVPSLGLPDKDQAFMELADRPSTPPFTLLPQADEFAPTVLLVEDNADMQRFMADLLARDYKLILAADGQAGLEAAHEHLPDLVVSDVMMPRMSGYEMCRALKQSPDTANIPVMLVSAMHGTEASVAGFAAGADDFVVKPFSPPELFARIQAQIRIRQMQAAMIRMERQTTLGIMAGGVAHEVLNPVNAILVAMNPIRKQLSQLSEDKRGVAERLIRVVEHSGERIHTVVNSILALSRQDGDAPECAEVDLRAGIDSVLEVLEHRMQDIEVELDVADIERVHCIPELLFQAVMNLCSNAIDAMPEGGRLKVAATREHGEIVMRVADTGPGIASHLRTRVFVPFFTTKPPGKGTGLGLAITREIAELHGGTVGIEDTERGCGFRLAFPDRGHLGEGARESAA